MNAFDRATQDIGNIVEFGHVNLRVPDQALATQFYVAGLGLTRDPYMMVGLDNMWVNAGASQFHLPTGSPQIFRGIVGLVLPDPAAVAARLETLSVAVNHRDDGFDVRCPWGNRIRCHAPDEQRFGPLRLGMPYVEIEVAPDTATGIARFYREVMGAPAIAADGVAKVTAGADQQLVFRETSSVLPPFDGHHIQITLADFSGPHSRLQRLGLITEESNQSQYRFEIIQDIDTGRELARLEHEVRSMRHPQYNRPLINRET